MKKVKILSSIFLIIMSLGILCSCSGVEGPQGPKGEQGIQGEVGPQGQPGKDGSSVLTGNGEPSNELGVIGDSYIDLDTWNFYVKKETGWVLCGNIKGEKGDSAALDHNGTEGLEFYPINETECAVAVGTAKLLKEIVVPSTYKNYTITTIFGNSSYGLGGFYSCVNLESITIPNSVTSIGDGAFENCSSLTNVYYSGTIDDWCNITFNNYYSNPMHYASHFYMLDENNEWYELTNIEIPNTVTSVGDYQFCGFNNVTEFIIPNSVTNIRDNAFKDCASLISIEIPNSVTSIGEYVFSGCSSLESMIIPNSVTNIKDNAFKDCASLISIEIPNSVISIGEYAFSGCSSLESMIIPNSVTSIGYGTFNGCSSLESITLPFVGQKSDGSGATYFNYIFSKHTNPGFSFIPNSLKEVIITGGSNIGANAFSGCSSLTSITIPDSVELIGERAFENCSSLTSIVIPDSVTSIGYSAFSGCSSLTLYCEASSKPSGWNSSWNSNRPFYWADEWEYDADGNPVPLS